MRRLMLSAMIGMSLLAGAGCIAVAKNNTVRTSREVVAVDGRVYVIDTQRGSAREVDLSKAEQFGVLEDEDSDRD